MAQTLKRQFDAARDAGVPLIAIETADAAATMERLVGNGEALVDYPAVQWDLIRGYTPRNKQGAAVIESGLSKQASGDPELGGMSDEDPTRRNPVLAVVVAADMRSSHEDGHVVFLELDSELLKDPLLQQAVLNLRDPYKGDARTLVLLTDCGVLPRRLRGHVLVLDEPRPDDAELKQIVRHLYEDNREQAEFELTDELLDATAARVRGTIAFSAETLVAMALKHDGIDAETLKVHAKSVIEETAGLSVETEPVTFDDIGGLAQVKRMGERRFTGPRPPRVVVRLEEIEKATAGARGDLSGTSGDIMQVLLSEMEDNNWSGMLAFGGAGTGKSLMGKAMANTFGALPMRLDLNACKGSLVGQSEQQIREAMKVIRTIGGSDVFFVASMNEMSIDAPLRRRFRAGVWFFDAPDAKERAAIWEKQKVRYGIDEPHDAVDESDMTGADIRNICEIASDMDCSLAEAKEYTVLLKHSAPESIQTAREAANNRYNSASYPGRYRRDKEPEKPKGKPKRKLKPQRHERD